MLYQIYNVTAEKKVNIETEILFAIAEARTNKVDLIRVDLGIATDATVSHRATVGKRYLRAMKKAGKIQAFVHSDELSENTTDCIYILNKYPTLTKDAANTEDRSFFIVKL